MIQSGKIFDSVALLPAGDIRRIGAPAGHWKTSSGAACFDAAMPGEDYPCGWVLLRGALTRRSGSYCAQLYYDLGAGFTEEQFFEVPVSGKGVIDELIWLPAGIKRMEWSPINAAVELEPPPLSLSRIGALERCWRMARRVVPALLLHSSKKRKLARLSFLRMLTDLPGSYRDAGKLRAHTLAPHYQDWIARFDAPGVQGYRQLAICAPGMTAQPKISLLLSVQAGSASHLSATIESVCAQIYPHWELRIIAASSCGPAIREVLGDFVRNDARISVRFLQAHRIGAVAADAVRAGGAYLGILGERDTLAQRALYCIAVEAAAYPDAALLYSDEDSIDEAGVRFAPNFKPDWNPQLLLSQNYLGGLCVFRAEAVGAAGGFQNGLGAAGSYDLALRVSEAVNPQQIRHLSQVLYHRRTPWDGAAPERVDEVSREAGRQVLEAYLARNGIRGQVLGVPAAGGYRIRYAVPAETPLVSIIIPTRDRLDLLRRCIASIRSLGSYAHHEILVVDNQSGDPAMLAYLDMLATSGDARVLRYDRSFNYPAINNFAVRHARGKVLCLLNNDTEVITPAWLEEMLGLLYQKDVGVVGAKLLYPGGMVQHGGDLIGVGGVANHAHAFLRRDDPGYQGRALLAQDMSAVTGACLMVWKSLYETLGGLDERYLPVTFNDVDFCLRVREAGYRVVWTPHAELYHRESASRGKDRNAEKALYGRREAAYMRKRWKHALRHDPFYNPNLSHERPDFSLSNEPMAEGTWLS